MLVGTGFTITADCGAQTCFEVTNIIGYSPDSIDDACTGTTYTAPTIYSDTDNLGTCNYLDIDCTGSNADEGWYLYPGHYRYWNGTAFTTSGTYIC